MTIYGDEFAHIGMTEYKILIRDDIQSVECPNVERLSYTEVRCTFNDQGKEVGCLDKYVTVEVKDQVSNSFQICYASVVLPSTQQLLEGTSYTYNPTLTTAPSSNVVITITSSNPNCAFRPSQVTLNHSNYNLIEMEE